MTELLLSDEQCKAVALDWIKQQQQETDGYKKVLDVLLMGAHFAKWSWLDAIQYAVTKCAKAYCLKPKQIIGDLK
jgi:hypothetical protein